MLLERWVAVGNVQQPILMSIQVIALLEYVLAYIYIRM